MKVRTQIINPALRVLANNAPTLLFAIGLLVLCIGVAQWSKPASLAVAGLTLMTVGAMPAIVALFRARARKEP